MSETASQGAEATEAGNDMLGLGHELVLRLLRNNVNADCVSLPVLRVMRSGGLRMDVSQTLRAMRTQAGFSSMEDFAKAMGYSRASSIQRYETEGNFPDGLPLNFVQKALPVLAGRGIPEAEILALAGEAGGLIRGEANADHVTKNLDEIPISRLRTFIVALAEYQRDRSELLSPDDQGDVIARVCRWYEEEVASGREPPDVTVALAKRIISVSLGTRAI